MMSVQENDSSIYQLTLLRHGESVGNAEGYHQGQADFPLTEKGRWHARTLAEYWSDQGVTFDQAIASPLSRARETAEIITTALDLPLALDPLWMERNNGKLAGLSHAEAAQRYPVPDFVPLYQPIAQTGESLWNLFLRGAQAVETIMRHPPGRYLIVSHGGLLNMAFHAILGVSPHANFQGFVLPLDNTAYSRLDYTPQEGQWRLRSHNERPHIHNQSESESMPKRPPDAHQFILLRHGESVGNAQGVLQGQADYPLSDRGREQARLLATRWKKEGITFDRVLASPLLRARETAQIVTEALGIDLQVDPDWMEFDWGELNGLTGEQIRQRSDIQWDNPYYYYGVNGESRWKVFLRAGRTLQNLIEQSQGRTLIVAHGAILSRFLFAALGITPQSHFRFSFENTAFTTLQFIPSRHVWMLQGLNDHSHLRDQAG